MAAPVTAREQIGQRIEAVEKAFEAAHGRAKGGWGDTAKAVAGAIQNVRDTAVRKFAAQGRALEHGATQAQLDKWLGYGRELLKDASDLAGFAVEADLRTVIADTAKATAKEVADTAGGALVFWGKYGKTIIVAAGVLVALVVVVKLRKAVA